MKYQEKDTLQLHKASSKAEVFLINEIGNTLSFITRIPNQTVSCKKK